ncbi:MAG: histidine kinase, partial [Propionibacteriaceae bacterium]|nr:histidine kinase [Propionibacteriaceae bacterium]
MVEYGQAWQARWLEPALSVLVLVALLLSQQPDLLPASWAISVALCVTAGLSGVWPRTMAGCCAALMLGFLLLPEGQVSLAGLCLFIVVFALVRFRVPGSGLFLGVLCLFVYLVMVHHSLPTPRDRFAGGSVLLLVLGLSIGGGMLWRSVVSRIDQERVVSAEQLQSMRNTLARDLHDTVAQALSHAAMRAHLAALTPGIDPRIHAELTAIATECAEASQDLRQLLSTLRERDKADSTVLPMVDAEGLGAVVQQQVERVRAEGFQAQMEFSCGQMSVARATTLARITVEAATNIIKHATPGSRCEFDFGERDGEIVARFTNQTDARQRGPGGLGLLGISERAAMLGGTATVSLESGVWTVRVSLP